MIDASADRRGIEVVIDLHTHPLGDGTFGQAALDYVARHLEAALEAGLDCIGVTDHDELRSGLLAVGYAHNVGVPLVVVPGMEVTTSDGHLVLLGIDQPVAPWRSMTDTVAAAKEVGALCVLPHPFFPALRARTDVDAIERYNARYGDFEVNRDDVAVIASSDAHSPADLLASRFRTHLLVAERSWDCIAAAIRARRVTIVDRDDESLASRQAELTFDRSANLAGQSVASGRRNTEERETRSERES